MSIQRNPNRPLLYTCSCCGGAVDSVGYNAPYGPKMQERQWCFSCVHWDITVDRPEVFRIGRELYSIGPAKVPSNHNGMSGRWFHILFADGTDVKTCDLWSGGTVPERWISRIKRVAEFAPQGGSAGLRANGEAYAWNPMENPPK